MVFTNYGKEATALRIGSDIPGIIQSIAIGSGSGTAVVGDVTLVAEHTRAFITGSPDFGVVRKVGFQADFSSITMSGLTLTEFGLFTSGATLIGSTWQREAFGSVVFDGTNELQIFTTIEVV